MPPLAKNNLQLDPNVWGPHFWFFLHTLAISYPHYPNAVTKKKYYELIQNLPLFIPVESIGHDFIKLLDDYPVTAYLDNKESLIKWMHFIHNKINEKLEKPTISLSKFYANYYEFYKPKNEKWDDYLKFKQKIIYFIFVLVSIFLIYYCYDK